MFNDYASKFQYKGVLVSVKSKSQITKRISLKFVSFFKTVSCLLSAY